MAAGPNDSSSRRLSRRHFLAGAASAAGAGLAMAAAPGLASAGDALPLSRTLSVTREHHRAWVWRFTEDGPPDVIRRMLRRRGMGVMLKTHDGTRWMSRYDRSEFAIAGPRDVERYARFFEDWDVPFHAWCVVKGIDPRREARMIADVLSAGARSITLDLESYDGFWQGSHKDAVALGRELRKQTPGGQVVTSTDARPWEIDVVPTEQFAEFSNAWAPQTYWGLFTSRGNVRNFREHGEDPGEQGVTPRFVVEVAMRKLAPLGLPIHPIGDGTVGDEGQWREFIDTSFASDAPLVSVWRYGVTEASILRLLEDSPPPVRFNGSRVGDHSAPLVRSHRPDPVLGA